MQSVLFNLNNIIKYVYLLISIILFLYYYELINLILQLY